MSDAVQHHAVLFLKWPSVSVVANLQHSEDVLSAYLHLLPVEPSHDRSLVTFPPLYFFRRTRPGGRWVTSCVIFHLGAEL